MDRVINYKSDALPKNLTAKHTPAAYERKKVIMEILNGCFFFFWCILKK